MAVLALRESVAEHFANVGAEWEASEIPVGRALDSGMIRMLQMPG